MPSVIELQDVTKDYGHERGILGLTTTLKSGEVRGFLGPNGAGKTTTIRHLMGFIQPDSGSARINGLDCFEQRSQIQRQLGYLPGDVALMEDMTGREFLRLVAGLKGVPGNSSRLADLIERFELDPTIKIRKMSKGTRQKVGIAAAFMVEVPVLLLDEPTSGLDPLMQAEFVKLVKEEKSKGCTILLSSHLCEEIEKTCDVITVIRQGRLVVTRTLEEVYRERRRTLEVTLQHPQDLPLLRSLLPHSVPLQDAPGIVHVPLEGSMDPYIKALAGVAVKDLAVLTPSLEDMFLDYYQDEAEEAAA